MVVDPKRTEKVWSSGSGPLLPEPENKKLTWYWCPARVASVWESSSPGADPVPDPKETQPAPDGTVTPLRSPGSLNEMSLWTGASVTVQKPAGPAGHV